MKRVFGKEDTGMLQWNTIINVKIVLMLLSSPKAQLAAEHISCMQNAPAKCLPKMSSRTRTDLCVILERYSLSKW